MESNNHLTTTFSSNNQECEFELTTHEIANSSARASCPIKVVSFEEDVNLLACDYFEGVLRYINQMLMEEDLENRPCMLQDSLALQATEKSFYDALSADHQLKIQHICVNYFMATQEHQSVIGTRGKRCGYEDFNDSVERRTSSKYLASGLEELDQTELYDTTLLCSSKNPGFYSDPPCCQSDCSIEEKLACKPLYCSIEEKLACKPLYVQSRMPKRGRPRAGSKRVIANAVDLWSLLAQCAQAVTNYDTRTAYEKLKLIRLHCSPHGEATERMAHYFADALKARLASTGIELYKAFAKRTISVADILKAFQVNVTACPFGKMSNIFANKSIGMSTREAKRISQRPSGPPKLRVTGIDIPQPGFRPAERVEETGHRLANYCKRFNVPFEYNAIAKKWDSIQLEDLKITKDEMLVVNCLYRLIIVSDETVYENSPRDDVLRLIKQMKPDVFLHGIVNGAYNSTFFITRFKEALFHFSSHFDMTEATVRRENQERILFEKVILEIMNIVACEGTARVERPEPYKQWQLRNQRAGFRQLPLDKDIIKEVRAKVHRRYHKGTFGW